MSPATDPWLARYQRIRRPAEVGFWVLVIGLQCALNIAVGWFDQRDAGLALPLRHLVLWELSSHLVVLALVPLLVVWERRHPLHWDTLARQLPWHLLGSLVFSLLHVTLMVALRAAAHAAMGERYDFGAWPARWLYEYLKDVRAYALIIGALAAYRWVLLRLQGEARVLDAPEVDPELTVAGALEPVAERPQRFLVRKLRREFLINAEDIEWVQAQANYVGLRVHGHDYLLRSTLTDFAQQLDPALFVRVHRSYIVNLDRLREIEPLDSGDARLHMHDGTIVPCGRRWRDALAR